MAFVVGEVTAPLTADTKPFERSMDSAKRKGERTAKSISKNFAQVGERMRTLGSDMTLHVTAPLAIMGGGLVALGNKFDKSFANIRKSTGKTGEALETLKEDFRAVYAAVPDDAEKLGQAIGDLNSRLGVTGPKLRDVANLMSEFSRVTGTDLNQAVLSGTRLLGDWSIQTENARSKLDKLMRIAQDASVDMGRLMETVVQFGAPFRALGFTFEESAALLAKFEKEGVNTETILSGLRFALGYFARTGQDAQQGFKEVTAKIKEMGRGVEATSTAFTVFGQRAANDMVAAIVEGRFEIEKMLRVMEESQDTLKAAADDSKTLGDRFNELKHEASLAAEGLGTELLTAVEDLFPAFRVLIKGLEKVMQGFLLLPKAVRTGIIAFTGLLAVAGPAIYVLGGLQKILFTILPVVGSLAAAIAGGLVKSLVILGTSVGTAVTSAGALTAGLVAFAGVAGVVIGLKLAPWFRELAEAMDLIDYSAKPVEDFVNALIENEGQFRTIANQLNTLKKNLKLTGEEWQFAAEHTEENARRVAELYEAAVKLAEAKGKEARETKKAADAQRDAAGASAAAKAQSAEQKKAVKDLIEGLEDEVAQLERTEAAYLAYKLGKALATPDDKKRAEELRARLQTLKDEETAEKNAAQTEKTRARSIDQIVKAMSDRAIATEFGTRTLVDEQLKTLGADQTTRAYIQTLYDHIEAEEARQAATARGAAWRERIMTLDERRIKDQQELKTLLDEGIISQETYAEALAWVAENYDKLQKSADKAATKQDEMTQYSIQAARQIQDAFADFLFDPFEEGLEGMYKSFLETLRKMISQMIASQVLNFLGFQNLFTPKGGAVAKADGGLVKAVAKADGGLVKPVALADGGIVKPVAKADGGIVQEADGWVVKAVAKADGGLVKPVALADGGIVQEAAGWVAKADAKADGGKVAGVGSDRSDNIPAWLSPGEFVLKAASVRKYGVGFLEKLNDMVLPADVAPKLAAVAGPMPSAGGYASGGLVTSAGGATSSFNLSIDARGADHGVAQRLEMLFARERGNLIRSAAREAADLKARGGAYAEVFRR